MPTRGNGPGCDALLATPGFSVSENPPAARRHFVPNMRLCPAEAPDPYRVDRNVLIYRTCGTDLPPLFLPASRQDE